MSLIANSSASTAARRVNREGCNLCSDFVDQLLKQRSKRKCYVSPQGRNEQESWRLPQAHWVVLLLRSVFAREDERVGFPMVMGKGYSLAKDQP